MNRVAVVALSALALAVLPAVPAGAARATCGSSGNYTDGASSDYSTAVFGVRATIETNDPALCSPSGGSPSLSAAWAMLTPDQTYHWAQAGYIDVGSDNPGFPGPVGFHYFAQYTNKCQPSCTGSAVTTQVTGNPGTASHTYAAYLRSSDDRINMTVDGNTLLTMNYDVTGEWVNSWAGQFAGETHHPGSDVPGTSGDRTRFDYIQKYSSTGAINFMSTVAGVGTPPARYQRALEPASGGGTAMFIWTDPL